MPPTPPDDRMVVILLLSPCTCSRSSSSSHAHAHEPAHSSPPSAPPKHKSLNQHQHQHHQHLHHPPPTASSSPESRDSRSSNESCSTGDTAIPAAGFLQRTPPAPHPLQPSHSRSYRPLPAPGPGPGPGPAPVHAYRPGGWAPLQSWPNAVPNAVPKPPRQIHQSHPVVFRVHPSLPQPSPSPHTNPNPIPGGHHPRGNRFTNANATTNTTDYVRHVTRVNFYDIDTSQVEFESKDDEESTEATGSNCDTEAITKEGEYRRLFGIPPQKLGSIWPTTWREELSTKRLELRLGGQLACKHWRQSVSGA